MKKKKNLVTWLVVLGVVALIILLPILSNSNTIYDKMNFAEMKESLNNEEFTLIYVGQKSCDYCEQMKPFLADFKQEFGLDINYLDYGKLSSKEKEELRGLDDRLSTLGTPTFIFVKYGEIVGVKIGATSDYEEFRTIFLSHYEDPVYYEVISGSDFVEKFKSKEENILVISQTTCGYCTEFKPVLSNVANEYDLDIYVVEFDTLTTEEKGEILALDDSFASISTPWTLITKKGEIVDSLNGATDKTGLVSFLEENKIID